MNRFALFAPAVALLAALAWTPVARGDLEVSVDDLQQAMTKAIADVAPSVVQVIVPEMTARQKADAKQRERQRRLKAMEEEEKARQDAKKEKPADEQEKSDAEKPKSEVPAKGDEKPAAEDRAKDAEKPAADEQPKEAEPPKDGEKPKDTEPPKDRRETSPKDGEGGDTGQSEDGDKSKSAPKTTVGTGLIVGADGYIVTSLVNVGEQTEGLKVRLSDGRELAAERLGQDVRRDVVLLKVQAEGLPVARTAPSDKLAVGQWVIALGRALLADQPTASKGILSATGRMAGLAVQTDANISRLNYGGPLVDIEGRVVAMIAAVGRTGSSARVQQLSDSGIGFAIPIDDILSRLPAMKKGEHILVPFLGVEFNVTRLGRGAQVMRVVAVTAAQEAGVKSGDIILAIDEATIDSPFQLQHIIGSHDVGDTVTLTIDRGGKNVTLKAKLRAMRLDQMR